MKKQRQPLQKVKNWNIKRNKVQNRDMKKKFRIALLMFLVGVSLISFGCGKKEAESAKITRDDARVGGSLSFVYNKDKREILVGGDGEVIQYSLANDTLGFDSGCRIGLKIAAPDDKLDLSTATLKINDVRYSMGDFLEKINDEPQRFFTIFPEVSKEDDKVEFSICWSNKTKRQDYKLIIEKGTKFMDKDGNIL